jgi:hypothetical protein
VALEIAAPALIGGNRGQEGALSMAQPRAQWLVLTVMSALFAVLSA